MQITNKIKGLLQIKGKKNTELAVYLNITAQSLSNKFNRGSFSAEDLIKISNFLECELAFILSENQKIVLEIDDVRDTGEKI